VGKNVELVPETYAFCRRCAHRVELDRVPFGSKITCPACGFDFVISRPVRKPEKTEKGRAEQRDPETWEPIHQMPPVRLLFDGVFGFPFRLGTFWQFIALGIGTVAAIAAVWLAVWCGSADNEDVDKYTRVILWNGLLWSIAFGAIVLPAWIYLTSIYGLAILRDTSHGGDVATTWPRLLLLEGVGQTAYVVNGLVLAALPGVLATPLWRWLEVPRVWGIAACLPVLFPLVLLSMLEADSPTSPFSLSVWRSTLSGWRAWAMFYLASFGVVALTVVRLLVVMRHAGWTVGSVAAGFLFAVAWMFYFRLLGRLAWLCSGRSHLGEIHSIADR